MALVVSPDGHTGVIANSGQGEGGAEQGDESLQVVDLRSGKVVQTVRDRVGTAPSFYNVYDYAVTGQRLALKSRWKSSAKAGAPTVAGGLAGGGIPNSAPEVGDVGAFSRGLALGPDGSSVLVTNEQGLNAVAVLDTTTGALKGLPTVGDHPTAVNHLVPGEANGSSPDAVVVNDKRVYVALAGDNAVLVLRHDGSVEGAIPTGAYPTGVALAGGRLVTIAAKGQSPIKHVVMVVRENRTFDQVFGDLAHALAARFGLSQNFYSDGEASIQGHHWTAEGASTDYTEKSWVHYYSNRNHPYDPTAGIVYPRCGAVFQQLAAQGKTFRNYGELVGVATSQTPTAQSAPGAACATPGGRYDGVSAASFSNGLGANLSLSSASDVDKEAQFEREYAPLMAADQMPQFSYVVLGNDHTDGTSAGKKTPQAHVATNDLAVGKLVDYLSHSKQWASTAVFVVEDDSQDGLDHRDGHRNIALLASPYARRGALSSLHISQASVLHTMELILGINPLSSYTQYAAVPYDLFTSKPDLSPYQAITPTYDMAAKNPTATAGTASSLALDLSQVDLAGPLLEAQVWEATRPGEPMPALLLRELATRGGVSAEALAAWGRGVACACAPRVTRGD